MTKIDTAAARFEEGCSCSQAVFSTFAEDFGIDRPTAMKLASGFGGGMGRLGGTCGAVTGAFMILGLRHGGDDKGTREKASQAVRDFAAEFTARHGSLLCNDLLACDISTPEGRQTIKDQKLRSKVCTNLVRDAAEILEKML